MKALPACDGLRAQDHWTMSRHNAKYRAEIGCVVRDQFTIGRDPALEME
jgi:hypothetical protein